MISFTSFHINALCRKCTFILSEKRRYFRLVWIQLWRTLQYRYRMRVSSRFVKVNSHHTKWIQKAFKLFTIKFASLWCEWALTEEMKPISSFASFYICTLCIYKKNIQYIPITITIPILYNDFWVSLLTAIAICAFLTKCLRARLHLALFRCYTVTSNRSVSVNILKWDCNPFWSDSIVVNENCVASVIAALTQNWLWRLA